MKEKEWMRFFPENARDLVMPQRTIYDSISKICNSRQQAKALYYYGRSITYSELLQRIDRLAEAFYQFGVHKGNIVSVLMPTTPESICILYALNKIGATPNFIDPRMDPERILSAVAGVQSELFVTIDLAYHKVQAIRDRLNVKRIVVSSASYSLPIPLKLIWKIKNRQKIAYSDVVLSWERFLAEAKGDPVPVAPFVEDSVAAIVYTGGTTGNPKGVMLTNDGLNTMADSFVYCGADVNEDDRFLEIMPIFASYGVGCGIHMPLMQGWELVVIPKFTPDKLGALIKRYKPNHMMAVPSFYEMAMNSKELRNADLSFLKTTGCGGETMNDALESQFNAFLKAHGGKYSLSQGYGMSEMSGAATCCFSAVYKDGSAGIPLLATTIGIFDPETGEEKKIGEQGEICATGRNMMLGYYCNEEETKAIVRTHADGKKWVHSGDIGYMDEDGFVFICGRIKQIIIKFDGHKVFPVSLESVINKNTTVKECAVIGISDPNHAQGEVPIGIVEVNQEVMLERKITTEDLRRELLTYCNEVCEERGKPADIVFISEMLYTGLNKHDYRRLKEKYKNHIIQKY